VGAETNMTLKKTNKNKQGQRTMNKGGTNKHGIEENRNQTRTKEPRSEVSSMPNGLEVCIYNLFLRKVKQD